MGYYYDKTAALMDSGKGTEAKTKEVIMMLDMDVFEPMRIAHREKYWDVMRKMHEIYEGCHYDKEFAMWEVEQMHHTDKAGVVHRGAVWTLDQVQAVFTQHKAQFKSSDNVYDLYVALHSYYHDNINQFKSWFPDAYEANLITGAINYFFEDEDAPEGKIWRYYQAMRKTM